jgi:hypothetical protein
MLRYWVQRSHEAPFAENQITTNHEVQPFSNAIIYTYVRICFALQSYGTISRQILMVFFQQLMQWFETCLDEIKWHQQLSTLLHSCPSGRLSHKASLLHPDTKKLQKMNRNRHLNKKQNHLKQLAPTDPILGPKKLLKRGFLGLATKQSKPNENTEKAGSCSVAFNIQSQPEANSWAKTARSSDATKTMFTNKCPRQHDQMLRPKLLFTSNLDLNVCSRKNQCSSLLQFSWKRLKCRNEYISGLLAAQQGW